MKACIDNGLWTFLMTKTEFRNNFGAKTRYTDFPIIGNILHLEIGNVTEEIYKENIVIRIEARKKIKIKKVG